MLFRKAGRALVVEAPAKLNLFLEILGKRPDGYHELETLMVSVGVYDTLSFTESDSRDLRLIVQDADAHPPGDDAEPFSVPRGRDNLIVRAAELLRDSAGVNRGATIVLRKRIPAAAGLAGGSSDAAATLAALNRLWKLERTPAELQSLASSLGSDIAFFLAGTGAAVCRGRGEIVEPVNLPLRLHFVIARPAHGLSTALVYRHCRPAERPKGVEHLLASLAKGRLGAAAHLLHNALQHPAEQLSPEISDLKRRFSREPVIGHMMSGSGSAYFGLCAGRRQALAVAARLRAARIGRVYAAQTRP